MEQNRQEQRKKRNRKLAARNRVVRTVLVTAFLMAAALILWLILKPLLLNKSADADTDSAESGASVQDPEAEDGSGQAGQAQLADGMTVKYTVPGWQNNGNGWWYAASESTYLYDGWQTIDGQDYHFDDNGYMDTGWTAIGGSGCYFDENGVYQPDASSEGMVALTFDDGPSEYTSQLLDILEENGAQATFMMLGGQVQKYGAECIPRMLQLGCSLGNHSYNHNYLMDSDIATVQNEFAQTDTAIAQFSNGIASSCARFPYGDYTKEQAAAVAKPCLFWDLDSQDWDSQDVNTICTTVTSQIETGNIILMHDVYSSTIEACRILIPQLMAEGYQFVTIEELAAARGYELEAGVTYYSFTDWAIEDGSVTDEGRAIE